MVENIEGLTFVHFKGGVYKVLGTAKLESPVGELAEGAEIVRYVRVRWASGAWDNSGDEYWRPRDNWEAEVEWPDSVKRPRFVPIIFHAEYC